VQNRRKNFLWCFVYKILKYKKPEYLLQLLSFTSTVRQRSLRTPDDALYIPLHRTTILHNSFSVEAVNFWNSLPQNIRQMPYLNSCRAKLFKHLFNHSWANLWVIIIKFFSLCFKPVLLFVSVAQFSHETFGISKGRVTWYYLCFL
jgi:hypothetical protein